MSTLEQASLKWNYVFNLANKLTSLVIPLIVTPYITRVFSSDRLGIYTYTNTVASYFVTFTLMGISMYGSKQISLKRHDDIASNDEYATLLTVQLLNTALAMLAYFLYVTFFVSSNQDIYWIQMLYVISAGFDMTWFLSGLERFREIAMRNVIVNLLSAVLIFIFVHTEVDLGIYTLIKVGTIFVSQLIIFVPVFLKQQFYLVNVKQIKLAYQGLFLLFIPVLADTLFQTMDKVMLGIYASYAAVGLYYSSRMITDIPQTVITSLNIVLFPRVTHLLSRGKRAEAEKLFYQSFTLVIALSIATAFGISAIAKDFVGFFFGTSYESVADYVPGLSLYICLAAWSGTIRYQYLIPHSMERVYVVAIVVGSGLNLILNVFLIPYFGVYGSITATIISELSICIYQTYPIRKEIPLKGLLSYVFIFGGLSYFMYIAIGWLRLFLLGRFTIFLLLVSEILFGVLIFAIATMIYVYIGNPVLWNMIKKYLESRKKV